MSHAAAIAYPLGHPSGSHANGPEHAERFLDCCCAVLNLHWQELITIDHDFTVARLTVAGHRYLLPVIRHGLGVRTLPIQALEAMSLYKQAERFALRRVSEPGP